MWSILIFCAVLVLFLFSPAQAVIWHCVHGNYLVISGERMKVPLLWWGVANSNDGSIELRKARIASPFREVSEGLEIRPMEKAEMRSRASYELAFKNADEMIASGKLKTTAPESLITSRGSFYCFKSVANAVGPVDIFCGSPDIPLRWSFTGSAKDMSEARRILQSIEPYPQ